MARRRAEAHNLSVKALMSVKKLVAGRKEAKNPTKGEAMHQRDYRIHLGHSSDGAALSWVIRATSQLEVVQKSRQWFEERLPSGSSPIQIDVYDAESGIERDNPEVPAAFQIEVDPRTLIPEHIRIRTDIISE